MDDFVCRFNSDMNRKHISFASIEAHKAIRPMLESKNGNELSIEEVKQRNTTKSITECMVSICEILRECYSTSHNKCKKMRKIVE